MQRHARDERGQASVEFVATLPFLVVAALVAWQLVLVGHVAWDTAHAARAGARAAVVGQDAGAAARSALPVGMRRGMRATRVGVHGVRISVPIPLVLYRWLAPWRMSATASLEN